MSNTSDSTSTATTTTTQVTRPKILGRGKLLQVLGIWFGIAAAVGNTIAAGIVRAPGDIALRLPNVWLFLGVWVVGGMYALFGASSLAELGAAIPRSGGQYNFSRRALGDYAGFIVGWSDWLSTAGTNAAVAIVIAEYSGALFAPLAGKEKLVAVGILVGFAILQWRGIKWGSGAQLFTAALKTAAFLVLVIACFVLGGHSAAGATNGGASTIALPAGWLLAAGFMLGLQKVIYTVDGWDGIIYFGEEVRNPGRDIPRAIFGSVFSIMAIYLLLNAAVAYVLPMNEIAGNDFALGTAAQRIFGRYGDPIMRSIMVISLLSCINACQMFCSRILYSMSCDGLFFRRASVVNKGGTPVLALFLSTVVGSTFIISRKFDQVIDMLAFFFVANYTLSFFSLFWLRWKEPKMERPYRAWGYPWTTGIALVGSVLFLFGALYADRKNSRWALLLLVLSYPIFKIMKWVSVRAAEKAAT
ncbi:MAG TPA: APC family permease [Candidatus Dormibacteraeota bacterium]|nr:APC family permease [Candidatus Dormibacteraeota bacterium]